MKKVIIINGWGACGKDKFVKLFGRHIAPDLEMENISTVDDVKEISKFMGWDGKSKTEEDRRLWVDLKKAWTLYNNGIMQNIVDHIYVSDSNFFFVHCREPHEIQKFVDYYDTSAIQCLTLLITREGIEPPNNESDKSVMNYTYDHTLSNDGTLDDLYKKAGQYYDIIKSPNIPIKQNDGNIHSDKNDFAHTGGTKKAVKCTHCGETPIWLQYSNLGGETYFTMRCKCKLTPYYGTKEYAIKMWEQEFFKIHPKEAIRRAYDETNSDKNNPDVPVSIIDDALKNY